ALSCSSDQLSRTLEARRFLLFPPLPVLRERVGVRVFVLTPPTRLSPASGIMFSMTRRTLVVFSLLLVCRFTVAAPATAPASTQPAQDVRFIRFTGDG